MTALRFVSEVPAPAAQVWAHATSFEGINADLWPLVRMTAPRELRGIGLEQVVLGERLCRSWLLLFGVIPIEYDDLVVAELEPGRRFLERSRMLTASVWQHERVVTPVDASSCTVTDHVSFLPRSALLRPVLGLVVPVVFRHRHRRLVSHFAARDAAR